jgi:hypothetical protein
MRGRKPFLAVAAVIVGAMTLLCACSPTQPSAPAPPGTTFNCTNSGDNDVCNLGSGNGTAPAPSPSPSAGASVACTDFHVFVSSFGWNGPADSVRPANQAQPYPLCTACSSVLTATLKGAQGDIPFAIASGKGRPVWSALPVGVLDIDSSVEATRALGILTALNNPDGYNLAVKPAAGVGATATAHVVVNALCVGEAPAADFKYVVTAK